MKSLQILISLLILSALAGCSIFGNKPPPVSEDGLSLTANDRLDQLYIRPGTDFSSYEKLYVEKLDIALDQNWLRQQNANKVGRIRPRDQERIFVRLDKVFREEFIPRFAAENGYELTLTPEPGSLTMKPALTNMRINAPDLMEPYSVTKFAEDAGQGKLKLELLDTDSEQAVLKTEDFLRARSYGRTLSRQTSVENQQEAMRMMRRWADAVNTATKPAAN